MKLHRLWPYTLFLILVLIFLWKPIFRGDALLPGDYLAQMSPWNSVVKPSDPAPQWNPLQWDAIAQFYPWRVFYARSMASGHIPLWNPHQFSGTPFLASGQSAALYPLNAVFLIFDPITAFTVFAALHLFLAQVFMYWLLRELGCKELGGVVGAIVFALSAFMVLWLELPTFVGVAVWLPLVLLLIHRSVDRKSLAYAAYAGGALALSILAGHLQIASCVTLAAVLFWLWRLAGVWKSEGGAIALRRVLPAIAVFVIIAGLISSAQLLPTVELGTNSPRSALPTAAGYDWFIENSLKPYRLITAFAPDFYGNPSKNNYYLLGMMDGHAGSAADYMEYGMYVGILPLILAGIALGGVFKRRHSGFFAFLGVFSLLVALGTVLNWPFYHFVPGFSVFGGPNRILLLYVFSVAALAGFGMDRFLELTGQAFRPTWRTAGNVGLYALAVCVGLGCVWSSGIVSIIGVPGAIIGYDATKEAMRQFFALGAASVIIVLLCVLGKLSKQLSMVLIVTLIIADLFAFGINYNPTCSRDKVYPKTELTDTLQRIAPNSRIAPINPSWSLSETPKSILPPNAAMVYGLYDVQGYDSLYTKAYKDSFSRVQGIDCSPPENGNMVLLRRLSNDSEMVSGLPGLGVSVVLSATDAPERYFSKQASLGDVSVYQPRWRPTGMAYQYVLDPPDGMEYTEKLRSEWQGPNRLLIHCSPVRGGRQHLSRLIVFAGPRQSLAGWTAESSDLMPRDTIEGVLIKAPVRNGQTVLFSYRPFSFRLGLFLSLIGIACLAAAAAHHIAACKGLSK